MNPPQYTQLSGEKYQWQIPIFDGQFVETVAHGHALAKPIAQALLNRGFTTKISIEHFLHPNKKADVPDPALMADADKAAERIIQAVHNKEKILICGDYDVDGITSSALMLFCLIPLGASVNFFLPNRAKDGYGLATKTVHKAHESGYTLMITVDNGITAFEPAHIAKQLGIDLIITDHHRPHDKLPEAYAIVNPNRTDCPYPFKDLAGVGVGFKLMSLVYQKLNRPLPQKIYELLLLGTVADVVPLLGENRFWVRHGLELINHSETFPLRVLKNNSALTKPRLSSLDIGFSIAPQINALGRLDDARSGVRFLIGADHEETERVGKKLHELNQTRKAIEARIFQEVIEQIESDPDHARSNIIIAASHTWPAGVIGLVASRLVGTYGKPAILFHLNDEGKAGGSCRSIPAFNMFHALEQTKDLLIQFGGHAQAAGLSLKRENIPALKTFLHNKISQEVKPEDLRLKLTVDAFLTLPDLSEGFMEALKKLEPFGHKNSQPAFYLKNCTQTAAPTLLKNAHVKCSIQADGVAKSVIFFNRLDLFEKLTHHGDKPFDLVAHVTENYWQERTTIELHGVDVRLG